VAPESGLLRLAIPCGLRAAPSQATERPAPRAESWGGKPSDSPAAVRARNDRKKYARRLAPFRAVPADVEWDAFLRSAEGDALIEEREVDYPGYRAFVLPRPASGTALGTASGTASGTAEVPPQGTAPGTADGTAGVVPTLSGAEALTALHDASRGVADLVGPAYERSVAAVLGSARVTRGEVDAMAAALASPAAWWPRSYRDGPPERVTLASLGGYRAAGANGTYTCEPLLALLAHVRAAARRAKAAPARPPAPPPPPSVAATAADARRVSRRLAASSPAPKEPADA
jgi:hypothetical protein